MAHDPFAELKTRQRAMWASFGPTAMFTTPAAAQLVAFAGVRAGESVLDVGTGTGVVAVTAASKGAKVSALDLTPALLEQARDNGRMAQLDNIAWTEGDAEQLPYADATFDVVLSQFGHMFAPRPEVVVSEMRRVLKPHGRIAFSTWPPEHFMGKMFMLIARNSPPPPPGAASPVLWGTPAVVAERLGNRFAAPFFARGLMQTQALSVQHFRSFMEQYAGPVQKMTESFATNPEKLHAVRAEFDAACAPYFYDNLVHQDYLMTRANAA